MPDARRVLAVAFDGAQSLDLIGPVEVFDTATRLSAPGYRIEVVAPAERSITLSNGLRLGTAPLPEPLPAIDTLVIAGGTGTREAVADEDLVAWIAAAAQRARRVASVCTGAFLLAKAGLLAGRRGTTHWAYCESLARRHPETEVDPDAIYVRDGDVWTSAGVTAGIDLALALVEADLGREISLQVARQLVVFLKRPGGQSQFSAGLRAQQAAPAPLRELQAWIASNLDADLSVPVLAARVSMSERSFQRAFRRETGETPAAYVESLRVERARILLEEGGLPVERVAAAVGLGSGEVLRRAFQRRLGVSPAAYRDRFRVAA